MFNYSLGMLQSNLYSSFSPFAAGALCDSRPAEAQTLWPKLHGLVHLVSLDQPLYIRWRSLSQRVMPERDRQLISQYTSQSASQALRHSASLLMRNTRSHWVRQLASFHWYFFSSSSKWANKIVFFCRLDLLHNHVVTLSLIKLSVRLSASGR